MSTKSEPPLAVVEPNNKVLSIGEKTITSVVKTLELDPDSERIIAVHFNKSETKLFIKEL